MTKEGSRRVICRAYSGCEKKRSRGKPLARGFGGGNASTKKKKEEEMSRPSQKKPASKVKEKENDQRHTVGRGGTKRGSARRNQGSQGRRQPSSLRLTEGCPASLCF